MKSLGELQIQIMQVIWAKGEATAADVQAALAVKGRPALTTVATVLSRLEQQGLVTHRAVGRTFYYAAAVSETDVRRSMVAELLDRLFAGDPAALVSHMLAENDLTPADLEAAKRLLRDAPPEHKAKDG